MKRAIPCLGLILFCACLPRLYGFSFEPITRDFSPAGKDSIRTFRLVNSGNDTVVVRIRILTRSMDESGTETNEPAERLFVVYPPRAVLAPHSVQAVKVQWKGPADLPAERCFRILVEQLPVSFGEERTQGSNIKVMFRYLGALYILPQGAKPNVILESYRPAVDSKGRKGLELLFSNRGKAHALLNELEISVTRKAGRPPAREVFGPEKLDGINGENLLPGVQRRFFIPLPQEFLEDDLDVAFRFETVR